MVVGHVVELVRYVVASAMNNTVITVWLKLLVKTGTLLPAVVKPVVTLIKQHQRLDAAPGTGRKAMLERIVISIIFLISVALVSSNLAFITQQFVLALTGVIAALASIAACMWGAKHE